MTSTRKSVNTIVLLTNRIEEKYGSVIKCPPNDPDKLALDKIVKVQAIGEQALYSDGTKKASSKSTSKKVVKHKTRKRITKTKKVKPKEESILDTDEVAAYQLMPPKKKLSLYTEKLKLMAIADAKKGIPTMEIALKMDIPKATISMWLRGVSHPPLFTNCLINKQTKVKIYFETQATLRNWCRYNRSSFSSLLKGSNTKYELKENRWYWFELPNGVFYRVKNKLSTYVKTDPKSFMQVSIPELMI